MKVVCSTSALRSDKRHRWQEAISGLYAPLDVEIDDIPGFAGEISRAALGSLELTRSVVGGEFSRRTRQHISGDVIDECLIVMVRQGPLTVTQFDRECELKSGSFSMLDLSEPYTLRHRGQTDSYFLKIPKRTLHIRLRDVAARCAVEYPGHAGIAAIGSDLIRSLGHHAGGTDAATTSALADHIVDFFGIMFEAAEGQLAESSSVARSAIHRRAIAHIDRHLSDPDLSPEAIATALRISLRYLHRAFEGSGQSVGSTIRSRRLTRCRDALLRGGATSRRISEIAMQYGFRNTSHFSTCFKAEFGVTPSAISTDCD